MPAAAAPVDATAAAAALQAAFRQQQAANGPTLAEVLRPEVLVPLLQDPELVDRLAPFLPEEHRYHVPFSR